MSTQKIQLSNYSEKAIVVRGDDVLKYFTIFNRLGGKYNENLKGSSGFIFAKTKESDVKDVVTRINTDVLKPTDNTYVKLSSFLRVLNRIDELEKKMRTQRVDKMLGHLTTADDDVPSDD